MSNFQPLESASKKELLSRYDNGVVWLDTHWCQSNTNNTLDVNGEPYEQEKFEKCCKILEEIESTLDKRFPGWRENRDINETISHEKVQGFHNGFFKMSQLNPSEQVTVIQDIIPGSRIVSDEE